MIHGDDDQIVPISAVVPHTIKPVENATCRVFAGTKHGIGDTHTHTRVCFQKDI
jgi:hypothetical protein